MARKAVIKIDGTIAEKGRCAGLNLRMVSESAIEEKTKRLNGEMKNE